MNSYNFFLLYNSLRMNYNAILITIFIFLIILIIFNIIYQKYKIQEVTRIAELLLENNK